MALLEESAKNTPEQEKAFETILKNLQEFGLTHTEAKIYIFLAKNGTKKAIEISKMQDIPRTETYHLLSSLQKKGIVTSTLDRPTKFEGLEFTNALTTLISNEQKRIDYLKEKRNNLIQLWNLLPVTNRSESTHNNKIQILQGKPSILRKLESMAENVKNELLIIGNEKNISLLYHSDFYNAIKGNKIKLQILTSCGKSTEYLLKGIPKEKIKIFPEETKTNLFYVIKDRNEMVLFLNSGVKESNETIAIWTDSKDMINSFKTLFELTWSKINSRDAIDDLSVEKLQEIYQHGLNEVKQEYAILNVLNKKILRSQNNN